MRCKIQAVTQNHFHSWVLWSINFIIRENVKMSKNTCMPSRRRSHGDWWGTIWSHQQSAYASRETHNWYETFYNNYQYDSKLIWFNMSLLSMIKWTCGSRHLLVALARTAGKIWQFLFWILYNGSVKVLYRTECGFLSHIFLFMKIEWAYGSHKIARSLIVLHKLRLLIRSQQKKLNSQRQRCIAQISICMDLLRSRLCAVEDKLSTVQQFNSSVTIVAER